MRQVHLVTPLAELEKWAKNGRTDPFRLRRNRDQHAGANREQRHIQACAANPQTPGHDGKAQNKNQQRRAERGQDSKRSASATNRTGLVSLLVYTVRNSNF